MALLKILSDGTTLNAPEGARLKEILEEADKGPLFGCGQGACGSCRIGVSAGGEHLRPQEEDERVFLEALGAGPEERLACQCRISSSSSVGAAIIEIGVIED